MKKLNRMATVDMLAAQRILDKLDMLFDSMNLSAIEFKCQINRTEEFNIVLKKKVLRLIDTVNQIKEDCINVIERDEEFIKENRRRIN